MRARCRRLLAILDGTPTGARGQSLVEMTLTVPILLVMLMGLVEVGWYANNYIVLLDNVREAGRKGATRDPLLDWEIHQEKNYHMMDCENSLQYFNSIPGELNDASLGWPWKDLSAYGYAIGSNETANYGFYDDVACLILRNMAPLDFNSETDDIVVSVFSYAVIDPNGTLQAEVPNNDALQVKVIGRFPPDTNECSGEPDPFDWRGAGLLDGPDGDANDDGEFTDYYDATSDEVRGFVMRGNKVVDDDGTGLPCLGSEFTTAQVEEMLNFTDMTDEDERTRRIEQMRKFGMVLVEMSWKHRQLFGMPWFNLGPLDDGPYIHVWAFFPVSGAELDLQSAGLMDPAFFQ